MKPIAFRILFLLALSFAELSFLPAMFPSFVFVPPVLFSLAASWAFLRGFSAIWPWAIVAGFLFDLIAFKRIGVSAIGMLIALAGFSVVSKRFLYGHLLERVILFGTTVWIFNIGFHSLLLFLSRPSSEFFSALPSLFALVPLLLSWVVSLGVFGIVLRSTRAFERYMELFEQPSLGK